MLLLVGLYTRQSEDAGTLGILSFHRLGVGSGELLGRRASRYFASALLSGRALVRDGYFASPDLSTPSCDAHNDSRGVRRSAWFMPELHESFYEVFTRGTCGSF